MRSKRFQYLYWHFEFFTGVQMDLFVSRDAFLLFSVYFLHWSRCCKFINIFYGCCLKARRSLVVFMLGSESYCQGSNPGTNNYGTCFVTVPCCWLLNVQSSLAPDDGDGIFLWIDVSKDMLKHRHLYPCLNKHIQTFAIVEHDHRINGDEISFIHFVWRFQYIPMPVLYGVFLYMGVTSLFGIQAILNFVPLILVILVVILHIYIDTLYFVTDMIVAMIH